MFVFACFEKRALGVLLFFVRNSVKRGGGILFNHAYWTLLV